MAAPVAYTVPHVVSHPVAAVNTPVAHHNVYAAAPVAVKASEPVEVKSVPAVAPVTYTVPQVYTHAVSSVGVPASTELLTKTVVAAPAAAAAALLLRRLLESRWPKTTAKRETRPAEVQKQQNIPTVTSWLISLQPVQ